MAEKRDEYKILAGTFVGTGHFGEIRKKDAIKTHLREINRKMGSPGTV
jgi:hypothetical protein